MKYTFKVAITTAVFLYCTASIAQSKYCLSFQGQNDSSAQIQITMNGVIAAADAVGSRYPSACGILGQFNNPTYTAVAVLNNRETLQCGEANFYGQNPPYSINIYVSVPGNGESARCSIEGLAVPL